MKFKHAPATGRRHCTALATVVATAALVAVGGMSAQAYAPINGTVYQLGSDPCLKGRGNCVIYPKAAELPSGNLVASWEKATVVASSGGATGETLPIWRSTDHGDSWSQVAEVKAPAYVSNDSAVAKYTSNWTNPYFYVLPQDVGNLKKGTLLLATVVSGEDQYYKEQKAANPNWTPTGDGDRQDMGIALYSSTDDGSSWKFQNIVATGGWEGGSAGNIGQNVAKANTYKQVDPIWEPYLMVYNNQLVAYYSDENDYTGYNTTTGAPTLDSGNNTAADSDGQILVHRTWDGSSTAWSGPVVDVSGTSYTANAGHTQIGGGRPGMTNVVPTSDGRWMITFEYFGGGDNVHYKIADNPLQFFKVGGDAGSNITSLPVTSGSNPLTTGGSPVIVRLPDGRIVFNANGGGGDIWVNASGSSTGTWTEQHTTLPAGYSRNLTWDPVTGRMVILANQGTSTIVRGTIDIGGSAGTYYKIVNRKTGQLIGTGGDTTDAKFGNGDQPDVRLEASGSATNAATELWHVQSKSDGSVVLLNKSGGRSASIWTGTARNGQTVGSWVDDTATGPFKVFTKPNGDVYFQSVQDTSLYLTGATAGKGLTLAPSDNGGGTQDWQLVAQ